MHRFPLFAFAVSALILASCASARTAPAEPARGDSGLLEGIAGGTTVVVDLTHTLNARTAYWPGPQNKPFDYRPFATIEKDQVFESRFSVDEHTGTHIDAPNHFVIEQKALDQLDPQHFFAPLVVLDTRQKVASNADYLLSVDDIRQWEQAHGRIPERAVAIMYSGWESRWDDFAAYKNSDAAGVLHFPGFSAEAAKFLVAERKASGLGIDALSVDRGMSQDFPVHQIVHGQGKYNLENVGSLARVPAAGAFLVIAPMKIEHGSGSPVRLFALVPQGKGPGAN